MPDLLGSSVEGEKANGKAEGVAVIQLDVIRQRMSQLSTLLEAEQVECDHGTILAFIGLGVSQLRQQGVSADEIRLVMEQFLELF